MLYRDRFNLPGGHRDLLADGVAAAAVVPAAGGPFAGAWRNYVKAVFQKGYMYRMSCKPSVVLYIAENKTLAGKEDRAYEGEAIGRKMAVVFFEDLREGLVRRVDRDTDAMQQHLLSIAEVLQTIGAMALPADPARTAAQTELLLEGQYQHVDLFRFKCTVEPAAGLHVYRLEDEACAESALVLEVPREQRTMMMLARHLQRHEALEEEETLQDAWSKTLATLSARAAHLLPAPAVAVAPGGPAAPPGGPAAPPAGRGRGRGRGRGAANAAPGVAAAGPAAAPAARGGRGRGRRGRGAA